MIQFIFNWAVVSAPGTHLPDTTVGGTAEARRPVYIFFTILLPGGDNIPHR